MIPVEIRALAPAEWEEAAGVVARGMRDNPLHRVVFGPDPARRVRVLTRLFRALFAVLREPPRVAVRGGYLVGVAGATPPGTCRLPPAALSRVLVPLLRSGVGDLRRTLQWLSSWGAYDPDEAHWHVGPVAVEGGMQGLGIGGRLLVELTAHLDARGGNAWLETDKPENVAFYRRFGFEVAVETETLGVPCWFMARRGASPRD